MSRFELSSSYTLGLFFIFSVSIIWSAASILVQFLYTTESFDSPFLLTYIGVSLFTILLPTKFVIEESKLFFTFLRRKFLGRSSSRELEIAQYENVPGIETPSAIEEDEYGDGDDLEEDEDSSSLAPPKWTHSDHMRAAIKIAPVWFIANWTYNASLAYTSITSSTVLASTGSVFTFLFAVSSKDEKFTCLKFLGVLLSCSGSILTALHDTHTDENTVPLSSLEGGDDESNRYIRLRLVRHLLAVPSIRDTDWWSQNRSLFGDALGLISAIGYGAYAVMVRVMCPRDESLMSMELLLGYIGLFSMVTLSPILFHQMAQGLLSDLTWIVFGFLVIKGLLDNVLSDYLWARAVVLTSATVATVGLGLTIPLAFISDFLWMGQPGDQVVSISSVTGALCVLAGFISVNIGSESQEQLNTEHRIREEGAIHNNLQPMQMTEIKPRTDQICTHAEHED